jgi:hypothetical protein
MTGLKLNWDGAVVDTQEVRNTVRGTDPELAIKLFWDTIYLTPGRYAFLTIYLYLHNRIYCSISSGEGLRSIDVMLGV